MANRTGQIDEDFVNKSAMKVPDFSKLIGETKQVAEVKLRAELMERKKREAEKLRAIGRLKTFLKAKAFPIVHSAGQALLNHGLRVSIKFDDHELALWCRKGSHSNEHIAIRIVEGNSPHLECSFPYGRESPQIKASHEAVCEKMEAFVKRVATAITQIEVERPAYRIVLGKKVKLKVRRPLLKSQTRMIEHDSPEEGHDD